MGTRMLGLAVVCLLGAVMDSRAEPNNVNTDWFKEARYGVFMHFLPADAKALALVDDFNVEALAGQLEALGAKYFIITLGQNSGYFISPNAAYDKCTGYAPGERCSKRDLPLDLSKALKPKGIRLMLYLPCQTPNQDRRAQKAFGLAEGPRDQPLSEEFAGKWAEVIREWADRYGDKVAGWWFDGGYAHIKFNEAIAEVYAKAAKHGNPNAIVTCNPGVRVIRYTKAEDYTAGELNEPLGQIPASRWLDGSQWHTLTYMGSTWGRRDTRLPADQWAAWVKAVTARGGVVTLDMGPNWDPAKGPIGSLADGQVEEVKAIKAALADPAKEAGAPAIPVRGLHTAAPAKKDLAAALEFIRTALPREGVNTYIMEFNYSYDFKSRPQFADPAALGREEVRQLAAACRASGITLIPQINCLGHQSWAQHTGRLLEKHPEFDETPGKYPQNKGIYCRSYCPLHPEVHKVLFDLIDELADACDAKAFHVGMDEIFLLADPDCPRCKGKDPAALLAGEVKTLHAHLKERGRRLWMWGDRFLDGKATGIGQWEASTNGTAPAIDQVPKDMVICDWHYEKARETPRLFAEKEFEVVACPWRNSAVALAELAQIRAVRAGPDAAVAARALGMVQTTWCGFDRFLAAYQAQAGGSAPVKGDASEAAQCFRALSKAMREGP